MSTLSLHTADQDASPLPDLTATTARGPAEIARTLATRHSLWRRLARFDPTERFATRVAGDRHWEAWLLTWLPGQATGLHDHGGSAGAFAILDGALDEATVSSPDGGLTATLATRRLTAGSVRAFGARHVHDVRNGSRHPAISLHVYAPALSTMALYRLRDKQLEVISVNRAGEDW